MIHQPEHEAELAEARERLTSEVHSLVELRPLPAIAARVNEACGEQDFNTKELAELVECDPAFAAKILSAVNSSMFGYSREVSSIRQALVVLGRKTISQLAICIAAQKVFSSGKASQGSRIQLYEHSLACASVSRTLATLINDDEVDPSAAFLAGMLHDVGKLIFLDVAPNSYSKILRNQSLDVSSVDLEDSYYGTNHTALGVLFGDSWNLSASICDAIAHHHEEQSTSPLTQITRFSNQLAKIWGIGQKASSQDCETTMDWLAGTVNVASNDIKAQAAQQFDELTQLLSS